MSTKQRGKLVREIAGRSHTDPFGGQVRYSRDTLDRWIRRYRAGGFDALVARRSAQPGARIDAQVLELAAALKRENPARTAAQVVRILRAVDRVGAVGVDPAAPLPPAGADGPGRRRRPAVFGRFEAADPNERWVGDALHGPRVGGRKTYLFAFLDDHSRLAVGYRFGFAEDTVRLAAALQPGAGRPRCPRPRSMSTTARRSSMRGCCGRARNSGSGWCIRHPAPTPRPRQDRTILSHRERTVPRRGHRHHREDLAAPGSDHRRRRCWS